MGSDDRRPSRRLAYPRWQRREWSIALTLLFIVSGIGLWGSWVHLPPGVDLFISNSAHWVLRNWFTSGALGVLATLAVYLSQNQAEKKKARTEHRENVHGKTLALHNHCWVDEESGQFPRTGQLIDPILLGVHPAADLDRESAPVLLDLPTNVPVYIPRDVDAKLDAALAGGRLVLIVGDSAAGKSRAAYEAMRRLPGDRRVLIPSHLDSIQILMDNGIELQSLVLWLDDLEHFIGPGGLDLPLLRRLLGGGDRRVSILATMRASEYVARSAERRGNPIMH
jgi:hypothetical protein